MVRTLKTGDLGMFRNSSTHFIVVDRFMRPTPIGKETPHLTVIINGILDEVPEFWLVQHAEVIDEAG
jgi:hypothetical protein